jgi:multiple sugar transport system ATP-binding protein
MNNSVEVKKLSFNYGKVEILKNLDLDIKDGEFMVLLGPSGCGKTTLLNCIAGLLDLDDGQIIIEGDNVTWKEPKDRHIGMVFQSYALYPSMSVEKNLSFGLRMSNTPKNIISEKIDKASELLQIKELLHRKPSQLSGGQRQRVAIGRALVRDAKVFLFDEPLSNLDAKLRAELRYEIKKLHRDLGNTMIYVTHDQIEAMTLADRIAVMKNGVIQQLDSPKEIYNKPASLFVADFIGSPGMNFFKGKFISSNNSFALNNSLINLNNYQFENKPSDQTDIVFGIRPEDIAVSDSKESMEFKIELIEPMGADTLIWLSFENIPFSVRLEGSSEYKLGDVININFDIKRSSVFNQESELRL